MTMKDTMGFRAHRKLFQARMFEKECSLPLCSHTRGRPPDFFIMLNITNSITVHVYIYYNYGVFNLDEKIA